MNLQFFAPPPRPPGLRSTLWVDGEDGQEDDVEDLGKGKLTSPTGDESPGEDLISNIPGQPSPRVRSSIGPRRA
jgi:hypothetical protein